MNARVCAKIPGLLVESSALGCEACTTEGCDV
jgi:hypothetical protein